MKEVNTNRFQKKQPEAIAFQGDPNVSASQNILKKTNGPAKAIEFIKETLGKEGDIVKAVKTEGGWDIEIEVVEQSEYMKKIGILKPVYDRNVYHVILDQNFEMVSYERKGQKPFGGAAE